MAGTETEKRIMNTNKFFMIEQVLCQCRFDGMPSEMILQINRIVVAATLDSSKG